jgi:3-hydroxyacyl-CoA dehydrogenase
VKGRLSADEAGRVLERLSFGEDLSAALPGAGLVIEAVFEDLETKLGVWRELGRGAPADAVLASRRKVEGGVGAPGVLKERIDRGELGRKTGRGFYEYGEQGGSGGDGKSRS